MYFKVFNPLISELKITARKDGISAMSKTIEEFLGTPSTSYIYYLSSRYICSIIKNILVLFIAKLKGK